MSLTPDQIRAMLSPLQFTKDQELTCDEWLAELPSYLDATPAEQAGEAFRLVREHLDVCPECRDEIAVVIDARDVGEIARVLPNQSAAGDPSGDPPHVSPARPIRIVLCADAWATARRLIPAPFPW